MIEQYEEFLPLLESEDKQKCVDYVVSQLDQGKIDIPTLYEQVLAPSLQNMTCTLEDQSWCIWKEHTRTAIVRTVIECCYPFVMKETAVRNHEVARRKVLVLCPTEEYHEIGARMVADYFTLCGYEAVFIGSNIPREDLLSALTYVKPSIIAISVTNYYNIIAAEKTIAELKKSSYRDFKVVVGGHAFADNPGIPAAIGAHRMVSSFAEIESLVKEGDA